MSMFRQLVIVSFFVAGLILLWRAGAGRRDRQWGRTAWIVAAADVLLFFGAAWQGWANTALGLWWLLVVGGAVVGVVLEVRNRRERRQLVDSALAAGIPPKEARRMYRRQLSSPLAVLGWWVLGEMVAVLAILGVLTLSHAPLLMLQEPTWSMPAVLPGLVAPWWMWGFLAADACAAVHVMTNLWRTGPGRDFRRTQKA